MKDDLEEFAVFILEELDDDELDMRNETRIYLVGKIMDKLMELRPPTENISITK